MATVATGVTLEQDLHTFQVPGTLGGQGALPFGELVLSATATWPALGAADVNVLTITGTLPRGYVYRILEVEMLAATTSNAFMADPEEAAMGLFTENQVTERNFILVNQSMSNFGANTVSAFAATNPSATNDHQTVLGVRKDQNPGLFTDLIDASEGVSILQITWVNNRPTTDAIVVSPRCRFLVYTVQQFNSGQIWNHLS